MAAFSEEVSDACSSVTAEVRDMLVCLAPSSKRKDFERKDNQEDEATLLEVRLLAARAWNYFSGGHGVRVTNGCPEAGREARNIGRGGVLSEPT